MKSEGLSISWQMKTIITFSFLAQCQASPSDIAWHVFCYHIVAITIETHIEPKTCTTADPDHQYQSYCTTEHLLPMLEPTHACIHDDTRNLIACLMHIQDDQGPFLFRFP